MRTYPKRMRWDECLERLPPGGVMAEIGVWRGGTCSRILATRPDAFMHLVDAWEAPLPGSSFALSGAEQAALPQRAYDEVFARCMRRLEPFRPRFKVHAMQSSDAALAIGSGTLDLVFIDADHSYLGVFSDIESWLPKVKPGGWIGGHDYQHPRYPGVACAVEEHFGTDVTSGGDRTWWHRCPG